LQLVSQTNTRHLLKVVCRAARELVGCKYAVACLDQDEVFVTSGLDAGTAQALHTLLPDSPAIRNLRQSGRICRLDSPAGDPVAIGFPRSHPPVRSFMGVPIVSLTTNYGWLCLADKLGADAFSEHAERIVSILAAQVARIYENRSLYADVQNKAAELENEVTERKKAEAAVRELNASLEQRVLERTAELQVANKELEAFSYSISHDLRAPLRHINGFAELLQVAIGTELEEKPLHYLKEIVGSAEQMGELVDNLLDFSRMGRAEICRQVVDLNALAQAALSFLEPETEGRNVRWKMGPLPTVPADAAMITQVFINLFSNAIKYTRPRDPAEIEVGHIEGAEHEIVVFVRDNGVGFNMEFADKLFGVFQRLHLSEDFEGVGIGLANVRRIITRHGGRAWAEGKTGEGATFFFSLPGV
ncbi:MAG: aphA, partial [Pedosphaera sp.]|nr:aphA [Pedosphaera sp.]